MKIGQQVLLLGNTVTSSIFEGLNADKSIDLNVSKANTGGLVLDLDGESVPAPALLQRLPGIPEAGGKVFDFFNKDNVVEPRDAQKSGGAQLGHGLRPICILWGRRRL